MKRQELALTAGALAAAGSAYALWLRPWHTHWGATEEESRGPLPGDELTADPKTQVTHAVTINAPVSRVWPWLAQVGQEKGGFYSYSWLENLVGCHMHNSDWIVPEFQHVRVGDKVWLHPKAPPIPVVIVEPERSLVFGSNTAEAGTWGLYLKPIDANTTRMIARGWGGYWAPGLLGKIGYYALFEPAHFVMERKMMLTIKRLAEQSIKVPEMPHTERYAAVTPKR